MGPTAEMFDMFIKRSLVQAVAGGVLVPAFLLFPPLEAFAKPTRLDCTLTSAGTDGKDTSRQASVTFDEEANTLVFDAGSQRRDLGKVTISTITIDGYTDDLSIGIDRSSWHIVVQTYAQDHVRAEFGVCKPAAAPAH
ncbi:hypothetical protein [Methylocella tundrae]|uniref:Uncharacterized protein n=1 Tax=Methylocella tundrae TaxID=227605 RepID=A0A4U8YYM9_METTU|nr:hypothetical protein [Methylocella tundrae]WPP06020.1 hypothetical protein SIN04_09545 [Methylocella tundrae]VFU08600.1 protein of unknown function [Methylocella tundrae]